MKEEICEICDKEKAVCVVEVKAVDGICLDKFFVCEDCYKNYFYTK